MKNIFFLILGIALIVPCNLAKAQEQSIDLTSVDKFFDLSELLSSEVEPSEKDWQQLFETNGYSISASSTIRKEVIKNMMTIAFYPKKSHAIDSILSISMEGNMTNAAFMLSRLTLENYLDMKKNMPVLKAFRQSYDFGNIGRRAVERLKDFLVNPVDSLISLPSINLLCYENDAQSKSRGIIIDFNLFFNQTDEERVNFLAHELFHTYRAKFINKEYIATSNFMTQIDKLQDEGIADLIDKPIDIIAFLRKSKLPESYISSYKEIYQKTPEILKRMDETTVSFMRNEISKEEFETKMKDFIVFGGHPNGYYMSQVTKNAGLLDEMLKHFDSPIMFLKIYNKAAKKAGTEYVFSDEFCDYIVEVLK